MAIDRRPWCRVETGVAGVRIESKDTLRKIDGEDVSEALRKGASATVVRVLQAMGVQAGVRVVTQCRVPEGSGLGESSALAAAVAGALAGVQGAGLDRDGIARIAGEADGSAGHAAADLREGHTAVRGGALALHRGGDGVEGGDPGDRSGAHRGVAPPGRRRGAPFSCRRRATWPRSRPSHPACARRFSRAASGT